MSPHDTLHVLVEAAAIYYALSVMFTASLSQRFLPPEFRSIRLHYWHGFGLYRAVMGLIHITLATASFSHDILWTGPTTWFLNQIGYVMLIGLVWHKPEPVSHLPGVLIGCGCGLALGVSVTRQRYVFPEWIIGRPYEVILLLAVAPLMWKLYRKPRTPFQNWLLASTAVFSLQEVTMMFSTGLHDAPYMAAHAIQIVTMMTALRALREFKPGDD